MQTYATHRRFSPLYHFVALPIFIVNFGVAAVHLFREPSLTSFWLVVVAFGLVAAIGAGRLQVITLQDRIIRLEERLRVQAQAPELAGQIGQLSRRQVAALRFASDEELPDLARRVLAGEFPTNGDIKRAVTDWRADHMRV
jgi:hypothetical protein